jgi:Cu-processing system ATP-binding protein
MQPTHPQWSEWRGKHFPASDTAAQDAAVALRGVSKHYGALHAVDGVDLDIPRGEIFGLIGHNGAGKSTLFKMMLGLVPATQGEHPGRRCPGGWARLSRSAPPPGLPARERGAVRQPQRAGNAALLSPASRARPWRNARPCWIAWAWPTPGKRPGARILQGHAPAPGFAQALLGQPRCCSWTSPPTAWIPQAIRDFYATLRGLQAEGVTIIITSHILAELQERVDRLAIMAAGKVQAVGSVQALREQTHMPLVLHHDCNCHRTPPEARRPAALRRVPRGSTPERAAHRPAPALPARAKMAVLAARWRRWARACST